jgi:hypothetical protein
MSSFAFDCIAILSAWPKATWLAAEKSDGWKITKFRPSCFSTREVRLTITPSSFFLSWHEVSSHLQQQEKQELHDQGAVFHPEKINPIARNPSKQARLRLPRSICMQISPVFIIFFATSNCATSTKISFLAFKLFFIDFTACIALA